MLTPIFIYHLSAAAVAGTAIIWRNWLMDHPAWKQTLERLLPTAHKILTCGSCFTYWLALAFTLCADPLSFWSPFPAIGVFLNIWARWMALSWLAVFMRFAYVAIQEHVHAQMHGIKEIHKH